ncbi:Uncharacterised protein [Mycobacterium tuberculosis]|nr:Uncharacterised protein [Mycobacterium tuberculosis]
MGEVKVAAGQPCCSTPGATAAGVKSKSGTSSCTSPSRPNIAVAEATNAGAHSGELRMTPQVPHPTGSQNA